MSVWLSAAVLLHNKQAIKLDYAMACDYKLMCSFMKSITCVIMKLMCLLFKWFSFSPMLNPSRHVETYDGALFVVVD